MLALEQRRSRNPEGERKRQRSFTEPFVWLVVMGTVLLGSCQSGIQPVTNPFDRLNLPEVVPQDTPDRTWIDVALRELFTLPTDPDVLLLNPGGLAADPSGDIYVADFGVMKMLRFGPDGRYLNAYGSGTGLGPGEFMSMNDLVITNDSIVHVLDYVGRRVSYFSKDGSFLKSRPTEFPSVRLAVTDSGREYALRMNSESVFESHSDAVTVEFGRLLDDLTDLGLIYGWLTAFNENLIYVPSMYPVIAQFKPDGTLVYARTTPDFGKYDEPFMERIEVGSSVAYRPHGTGLYIDLLSISSGRLHIRSEQEGAIDVYDAATGDYEHSFSLPKNQTTYVLDDRLYQIQDSLVIVYQIETSLDETE